MKKIIIFILLLNLTFPSVVIAQMQDKLWMMGYDCCVPNFYGINLDFRNGFLLVDSVERHFNFSDTNGQICDSLGNPLFVSNGVYVANSLADTMLNGSGLNPSTYTTIHNLRGLYITQANLVIPVPGNSKKYYLFHETSDDYNTTYSPFFLYYSIIDMNLDSGLGGVIQKNTILLQDTFVLGKLTAVKHANGRDWWLISHKYNSDLSFRFLITPFGISGPYVDNLITIRNNYPGQTVFSQDGSKYAYCDTYGSLDIWDFDRCSGIFNNLSHINIVDSVGSIGVSFSKSGRYIYITTIYSAYQFDLYAADVAASKIKIADYDGFVNQGFFPTVFYQQMLGPDGKIYINSSSGVMDYAVINNPDSAGLACDFVQHSIHLPGYSVSLPNHPNYFLGSISGSNCDSLTIDLQLISSATQPFYLFPNPVKNVAYITQNKGELIQSVKIFNSIGKAEQSNFFSINKDEYVQINLSGLLAGIYFVEIVTEKRVVVKKILKQ